MPENQLQEYRNKRNFGATNEPRGARKWTTHGDLKFAVQHHLARSDHYDLRLELNGVALSWAIPKGPSFRTADKRLAVRVEDHPIEYMDFEGIIPRGEYGGGTVMLWDEGSWTPRLDPEKGLQEGSLKFHLEGKRLKGDWALVRIEGDGEPWLLIKERDKFAKETAGISRFTRGIRSGKSMEEIADAGKRNPFEKAEVMLARLTDAPPAGKGWLYELKYDGHRTLAFCEGGRVALRTRNGHDCTDCFPSLVRALKETLKDRAAVLDGETVATDGNGVPDFGALQTRIRTKSTVGLCYVLFDLLALDGEDLRPLPLSERKEKLRTLLRGARPPLSYSEHTAKMAKRELEAIRKRGMEGIVIKRADSPYSAGKSGDWLKLKFRNTREFVIGGYLQTGEKLRSLLVGYYENGKLLFAGAVGTGFTEETRRMLVRELTPAARSPFFALPAAYEKGAVFTEPLLAAQVEYAEITRTGLLRQASFKGLRRDKPAREIDAERPLPAPEKTRGKAAKKRPQGRREEATVDKIVITHPEKVMFERPKIDKLTLAEYYKSAAPRMLPYVKDRILSLVCCPSGIGGERFFRKHLEGAFEGVGYISEEGGESFFVTQGRGLVALAQYNAVEFHIRGSKKGARPDLMVFDLDPDEGLPLAEVRRGATAVKETLEALGLVSFLKTSGGKGYHIVVPFRAGGDAQAFRDFSRGVAELLERTQPKRFTANLSKRARGGKIFLDWQRNSPVATSAAPYSVRAREGAPVSMPIAWEELNTVAPNGIGLFAARKRLKGPDPWADFFSVKAKQSLRPLPHS